MDKISEKKAKTIRSPYKKGTVNGASRANLKSGKTCAGNNDKSIYKTVE